MKTKILFVQLFLLFGAMQGITQDCGVVAEVTHLGCAPDGFVTIELSGGTGIYSTFDANEIEEGVFEESDLAAGTYTFTFTDSQGCEGQVTFEIPNGPEECCDLEAYVTHIGCAPEGWVAIEVIGGNGDYSSPHANQEGDNLFEEVDLDAGTYTFTIQDSDGCSDDVTFTIPEGEEECCNLVAHVERIGCGPDGWVAIHVTGGNGKYSSPQATYEGDGLFEELNLAPGTYTYIFYDSNGCSDQVTFTISDCCDLNAKIKQIGCGPDSWVAIEVTGGDGNYSSDQATYEGDGLFEELNLEPGTYTYNFQDGQGCQDVVTFTIYEELVAEITQIECSPFGSVTIQVTGGDGNYSSDLATYVGNGIFENLDLAAGSYTYNFQDGQGCQERVTVTIPVCCNLEAYVTHIGCAPEGWVAIEVLGGSGDYSSPDANQEGDNLFEEVDLAGDDYVFTILDSEGCEVEVPFTIPGPDDCCNVVAHVEQIACAPYGWVSFTVNGGSGEYTSPDAEKVGDNLFEEVDLAAGTYTYLFEDSEGCQFELEVTIPEGVDADIIDLGLCAPDGSVTIEVTGGALDYSISDGEYIGDGIFRDDGLVGDTYTYTISDAQGCEDDVTFTIPDELVAEVEYIETAGCGIVIVQLSGGTPPYTNYYNGSQNTHGEFIISLDEVIDDLTFGDNNGCLVKVSQNEVFNWADCSDFVSIMATHINDETINMRSGIDATLFTRFETFCVPDRVIIRVNGVVVVDKLAGTGGGLFCDNTGNSIEIDSFCVTSCDRVSFEFFSDVCSGGCMNSPTRWNFSITDCVPKDDEIDKAASLSDEELERRLSDFGEESFNPSVEVYANPESLELYPIPVTEDLTVNILNSVDQFTELRIVNNAGKTLITKNIAEQNQIILDLSSITSGVYYLEISGENGNTIIERFVKN